MMQGNDNTAYDRDKYPFAISGFQPAHRGEDGQYYLLPGLPIEPDTPDTPLPAAWKYESSLRASEGECGLLEAAATIQKPTGNGLPRVPPWLCWALAFAVGLLVIRNLPHVRDWGCWR